MNDLLIVGGGLAGSLLAAESHKRGINFRWMISETIPSASFAAYGICNPVQFRNMVPAWKADEFYEFSKSYFMDWQKKLEAGSGKQEDFFQLPISSSQLFYKDMPIRHLIVAPAEFVQWRQNVEITSLWKYTTGEVDTKTLQYLKSGYSGSILIQHAFLVNIPQFILRVREFLTDKIEFADFDHSYLEKKEAHLRPFPLGREKTLPEGKEKESWNYKGNRFDKIIFSEGHHGYFNPFFKRIPFNPCKGEIVVVKIPGLQIQEAIHKKIILIPLGDEHFMCGATYEWDDLSFENSQKGLLELESGLLDIIGDQYKYEIINQKAGVRPAISDRRPVVGWHPKFEGIGILNGFGSMGLMVGPSATKNLLDNLQQKIAILPDWDINRFKKRLLSSY